MAAHDLEGTRVIVTGGTSGLGLATAQMLAARGADTIVTARNAGKAAAALAAIRAATPAARVAAWELDLASLGSVREFAEKARALGPIDLLINNAGVMAVPRRTLTVDGFELQFATNHLGHFALTGLLLPALLAAPRARVVVVASLAHRRGRIDFDDLQGAARYSAWGAYCQSKLANLLFTFALQRRLAESGARAIAVAAHPGLAATNIAAAGPALGPSPWRAALLGPLFRAIGQSAADGALPILHAATAIGVVGGSYTGPDGLREMGGKRVRPAFVSPRARDAAVGLRLWRASEALTNVVY